MHLRVFARSCRRVLSSSFFPGIEFERAEPEPHTQLHCVSIDGMKKPPSTSSPKALHGHCCAIATWMTTGTSSHAPPFHSKPPAGSNSMTVHSTASQPTQLTLALARPEMTAEGRLWEDVNHFVDYLTCRDVALAHDLNELLLKRPRRALRQFHVIRRLMNRPLCRHEIIGRG